jgi:hypothetical protein
VVKWGELDTESHMNNNQAKPDNYADELDVYQAAWVTGKQRGKAVPLDGEKLAMLLEAGRINLNWLGDEEKDVLVKTGYKPEGIVNDKTKGYKNKPNIAEIIINSLYLSIDKDMPEVVNSEVWKGYSKDEKEMMRWHLFRLKYGFSPEYMYAKLIKKSLIG